MSDKTIDHLSNDAAQARAHGMSYGKYVAQMELKERSDAIAREWKKEGLPIKL